MGEVWRVRDELLRDTVVLKVCLPELAARPRLRQRFLDEARLTAQLHHPGILAVHELGELPDGRPWFTMEEVRGRTLEALIAERAAGAPDAPPLRALVEAFLRAAEAVAHAHAHGVVHRDLKPENLMVGAFGEVRVMDWGLARRGTEGDPGAALDLGPREGGRTQLGEVMGTPAYMAPEQASGRVDRVGPAADIYALGAVLYTVLAGSPPYGGPGREILRALRQGSPPPLDRATLPEALCATCERAMARDPFDRHPDARALADEVARWLVGDAARVHALAVIARADALHPEIAALRTEARTLADAARKQLSAVPTWAHEDDKRDAWALARRAEAARVEADRLEVAYENELRVALDAAHDLPEGLDRLADLYRDQLLAAEADGDARAASRAEARLRSTHRRDTWLDEPASLSLATDPPGVRVRVQPWVPDGLRLVPGPPAELGRTPLYDVPLPPGRQRLVLDGPAGEILLPLRLTRGEAWRPHRPTTGPWTLRVPRPGELGPDDVFVPGGWARLGGGVEAADPEPARTVWIDDFILRRHPVTLAEYVVFLDALVAAGRVEEAEDLQPKEVLAGADGAPVLHRDGPRFLSGNRWAWPPDAPVTLVPVRAAMAYAAWEAARTGHAWRLPTGLEREKAARGVDGRPYPWGDHLDPAYVNCTGSTPSNPTILSVSTFPTDTGPHGARGLAGNVRDWCADAYERAGTPVHDGLPVYAPATEEGFVVVRGGAYVSSPTQCLAASRFAAPPGARFTTLGFRLARSTSASSPA